MILASFFHQNLECQIWACVCQCHGTSPSIFCVFAHFPNYKVGGKYSVLDRCYGVKAGRRGRGRRVAVLNRVTREGFTEKGDI